jgi:hypothetical protein
MTEQATRRIRAVGDGKLPFVDAAGINQKGRFAGRDAAGEPIVEDVPDTIYYRRALRVGSLEECAGQLLDRRRGSANSPTTLLGLGPPPGGDLWQPDHRSGRRANSRDAEPALQSTAEARPESIHEATDDIVAAHVRRRER